MNNDSSQGIPIQRRSVEKVIYPPRSSVHIEDRDWNRWTRMISNISHRETIHRDLAFTCFGIAIPGLIGGLVSILPDSQIPIWTSAVYFSTFFVFLLVGVIAYRYDVSLVRMTRVDANELLIDMEEVYDQSARSEEVTVTSRSNQATSIG